MGKLRPREEGPESQPGLFYEAAFGLGPTRHFRPDPTGGRQRGLETAWAGLGWPEQNAPSLCRLSPPQEPAHLPTPRPSLLSPRPGRQAHGEGHQVTVGNSKEQHESDEVGVLREEDGQPGPLGRVAQHEERDEQDAQADEQGQQPAVLVRLRRELA